MNIWPPFFEPQQRARELAVVGRGGEDATRRHFHQAGADAEGVIRRALGGSGLSPRGLRGSPENETASARHPGSNEDATSATRWSVVNRQRSGGSSYTATIT